MPSKKHYILCGGIDAEPGQSNCHRLELGKGAGMVHLDTKKIIAKMIKAIDPIMHDLLEIATYVYVGDQVIPRGGDKSFDYGNRWHRKLFYKIPVCKYEIWSDPNIKQLLEEILSFAAGETYHFEFVKRPERDRPDYFNVEGGDTGNPNYEKVVMFSGGLDSFSGVLEEIVSSNQKICMVSHHSNGKVLRLQRDLHRYLVDIQRSKSRPEPFYMPVEVNKDKGLTREKSQRTRSFLFAVLGAIIANYENLSEVTFFENGIVSCNLPWDGQTLQARATRTTHPKLLNLLSMFVSELLQKDFSFKNPYFELTKKEVVDRLVKCHHQICIKDTRSCAGAIYRNPKTHCGICSQCVDRRFATLAAQCLEHDPWLIYKTNIFTESIEKTEDRAMATGFASFALQTEGIAQDSFLRKYPSEIAEIIAFLDPDKKMAMDTVFSLHKRYALQVNTVLDDMIRQHSKDFITGILPDTCLLQMVAMKEHLKAERGRYQDTQESITKPGEITADSSEPKTPHIPVLSELTPTQNRVLSVFVEAIKALRIKPQKRGTVKAAYEWLCADKRYSDEYGPKGMSWNSFKGHMTAVRKAQAQSKNTIDFSALAQMNHAYTDNTE